MQLGPPVYFLDIISEYNLMNYIIYLTILLQCAVDVEKLAGLNFRGFNLTKVFAEILSRFLT